MIYDNRDGYVDVCGYEGLYCVNRHGSVARILLNGIREIKPQKNSTGYYRAMLFEKGKGKMMFVHRLVAMAFLDNRDELKCINHIDGNKLNNKASNLEWCTYSHNNRHMHYAGLSLNNGERHTRAKLKKEEVYEIRILGALKVKPYHLAKLYGVHQATISPILKNKTWREYRMAEYLEESKERYMLLKD